MGNKLPPDQMELYRRVDEVLHYLWDPIGVASLPEARSEYHSYLPHVFALLISDAPTAEIAEYLTASATEAMGLPDTSHGREFSQKIAAILERWRDVIQAHHGRTAQ